MSNILLFSRCMGSGGTEKIILQLAKAYRSAGHHVYVLAEGGTAAEKLPALGVEFFPIPDMQSKSPKVFFKIMSTLRRILVEKNIDVVHTHHRMAAFYARLLLPKYHFLFLNNVHNTFEDKRRLTRFSLKRAVNIAVGQAVRDNLVQDYGIPADAVRVIPNAVEAPKLHDTPDETIRQLRERGNYIVANIGRVNTQKGFPYYLEAAKRLAHLPIAFLVVGDGDRLEETKQLARDMGLSDQVTFLGYRRDVADVIAQSDLIVLSSLWEGFPLTPIETFSMGKTIVATAVPGTMEIVTNEENGLIVPVKDGEAIAAGIKRLYEDAGLQAKLEAGAKQTYLDKFSYDGFCRRYLALLEEACRR